MIDLKNLTITKARKQLDDKDFSARELAEAYLKKIEELNPEINVYLEVYDDVLKQADIADQMISSGQSSDLTGIPLALKDNILVSGKRATSASKILEGFISPYDSTAVSKIKSQGAVLLGRCNMDEFAMGSSTENSAFGVTKNPHDLSRVAGGSSGGSAASVASDMALGALGSDTGGSVRQPASLCGVVGLKPTYGAVSRHGLMAMGSSLDIIGTIAKSVSDAEMIFRTISGKDIMDSTTIEIPKNKISKNKNLTIGVPYHFIEQEGIDQSVRENFKSSLKKLETLGYNLKEIELPYAEYSLAAYYVIMPAEVSSNLARFDGVKYGLHSDGKNIIEDYFKTRAMGFGPEVRRRIILGTYVLSSGYYDSYYGKALTVRQKISDDFNRVFKDVDVIATPTTPSPAFKIGEKVSDPLSMYLADIFTVTANIIGIPAISLPSGFVNIDSKNLPIGFQLMAPHKSESVLFELGKNFLGEV